MVALEGYSALSSYDAITRIHASSVSSEAKFDCGNAVKVVKRTIRTYYRLLALEDTMKMQTD